MKDGIGLEEKRLEELALRAQYGGGPCYTRFLEPSLKSRMQAVGIEVGVKICLWGGYADAERCIGAFWRDVPPEMENFPVACIELNWNPKYACPAHRDLLGAVMGLGLERDSVGDIAAGEKEGSAYLFVHRDVEMYVCGNLDSAGRAQLKVKSFGGTPILRPPQGVALRVTVSSLRLDAVLAAGYRLSRSEAQRLIESGQVKCNHEEILRGDVRLDSGDLLSVRGHGRMLVEGLEGATRKGRQALRLFKYTG